MVCVLVMRSDFDIIVGKQHVLFIHFTHLKLSTFTSQSRFTVWPCTRIITASCNIQESFLKRNGGSPGNRTVCFTTTTISTVMSITGLTSTYGIRWDCTWKNFSKNVEDFCLFYIDSWIHEEGRSIL